MSPQAKTEAWPRTPCISACCRGPGRGRLSGWEVERKVPCVHGPQVGVPSWPECEASALGPGCGLVNHHHGDQAWLGLQEEGALAQQMPI